MSQFEIKPATRQGIKPLIGLYSESGCGKTYSALLLARGMAGPSGRIVMVDTESGRGSLYADVIPGGYDVMEIGEPFHPERCGDAIKAAEATNPAVIIYDSASHQWESVGGVTDLAMDASRERARRQNRDWDGVVQFGDWKQPKMEHAKFMARLLQSSCPIILCLRAKYKSRQVKGTQEMLDAGAIQRNQVGKNVVIKDEFTSPIQAEDFIFEMTAHAEILHDHSIRLTKCSHPSLRDCFPKDGPITIQHGELLAKWCSAGGKVERPATQPSGPSSVATIDQLKKRLWAMVPPSSRTNPGTAAEYLIEYQIIPSGKRLVDLSSDELTAAIDKLEIIQGGK
jgi:hypothetical protein